MFGDGCDSCLRKILRNVMESRYTRIPFPFILWERRNGDRSISVSNANIDWVFEPHGNRFTVGKIVEMVGDHDFIVLRTSDKYVHINIKSEDNEETILVETYVVLR